PAELLPRVVHRQDKVPFAYLVGELRANTLEGCRDLALATSRECAAGKGLDLINYRWSTWLRGDHIDAAVTSARPHVRSSGSLAQEHHGDDHLDVLAGVPGPFDACHGIILMSGCRIVRAPQGI